MIQRHPDKNLVRPPISKISRAWCIPVVSVTLEVEGEGLPSWQWHKNQPEKQVKAKGLEA
jgi:hypothetical protein